MDFNLAEQLAVLKALDEIILSDSKVYEGEAQFITQLSAVLGFSMNLIPEARDIEPGEALAILQNMSPNKKRALAVMLNEAASSDGRVDEEELRLIYGIFREVGIDPDRL